MTPQQIAVVQASFARIFPVKARMAQAFYDRLFEVAPGVRPHFPEDMTHQRQKFADTLVDVVRLLSVPDALGRALAELSGRHRAYGARPDQLAPVGEALLHALERETPGGLSDAERTAWAAAYGAVAEAMAPHLEDEAA